MPCPRCGFHNLPGTDTCLSCRVPLGRGVPSGPGGVAVLTPPRATAWSKRVRQLFVHLRSLGSLTTWEPTKRRVALGLVPGLPQIAAGWPRVGAGVLGVWLLLLASAFFRLGTSGAVVFSGFALSVHVLSALLPYLRSMRRLPLWLRCSASLLAWAVLVVAVYLPLWTAVDRLVFPLRIGGVAPSLVVQDGDVVLVRRVDASEWRPERGRLVVFRHAWGVTTMDRVLGLAGDRIQIHAGRIWRDEVELPPAEMPLAPSTLGPASLEVVVPKDSVFVWPSLGLRIYNVDNARFDEVGLARLSSLIGEPWWIWQPSSRRRRLER